MALEVEMDCNFEEALPYYTRRIELKEGDYEGYYCLKGKNPHQKKIAKCCIEKLHCPLLVKKRDLK